MFLRKLLVVLLPLLMCLLAAVAFPLIGGFFPQHGFWEFALKGIIAGVALALLVPLMGGRNREAFARLYWFPTALLFLALLYQYLHQAGAVRLEALAFLAAIDSQILLLESAFFGFLLTLSIRASR